MMRRAVGIRWAWMLMLAGALCWTTAEARADLPPPDGTKFVSFGIQVNGLAAHPDHVLLVFPWSMSNGAPTEEVAVLEDGKSLGFGRRVMGSPKIWAMRKDAFEAAGPELKLPADGAVDCGQSIEPRFVVPKDAPDEIVERYDVSELGDGLCKLTKAGAQTNDKAKTDTAPKTDAVGSEPAVPSDPNNATARESGGGCAACEVQPPATKPPWPGGWMLLGLAVASLRRHLRPR
jgi:MYXO-CTERM domain-containing protein